MNNLRYFRDIANVPPILLSRLLNVTLHTYIAYEQEKTSMEKVIVEMLSLIYCVNELDLFAPIETINDITLKYLNNLSTLSIEDKQKELLRNLTGKDSAVLNYRNISKVKRDLASK